MRERTNHKILEAVVATDISTDGRAVGRHEGKALFMEGAVPGDVADVEIFRDKKNLLEGRVTALRSVSDERVRPVCEHFGTCGGCKWQHLSYGAQLLYKERFVREALERLGKVQAEEYVPIAGCDSPYFYRNKLEYTFSSKRWLTREEMTQGTDAPADGLGYHIAGMFDKVLDIRNCYLQPEPSNSIRNAVKRHAREKGYSFFDIRRQTGFLRTLMIRTTSTGETMVVLTAFEWLEKELFELLEFIKTGFPDITSLLYAHNPKGNDTLTGLDIKTYHGRDHIFEEMEGLKFKISARSFYQTNSDQAYKLYSIAREFSSLRGNEMVYDLYTGTGTIANFIARSCAGVAGIEYIEDAVADARENSRVNGIGNTRFFSGDMKDLLNDDFFAANGRPDVIITDPPRAGMHENVVKAIVAARPGRVVYVSCNPGTQARDIGMMSDHYNVARVQAVDMFPQTTHVESVALLLLK